MRLSKVVLLATSLAATPVAAQPSVDATIDKAVAAYNAAKTARASFEQTITNALTGSTSTSRGIFQQEQPNRFAFLFTDPQGDKIVADGQWIWVFLPSSDASQVIKLPIARGTTSFDIGSQFFSSPKSRFKIGDAGTATVDGHATRILTLEPKTSDAAFTHGKVWIDTADGTLRQFQVTEENGLTRLVKLSNVEVNVKVDPKVFTFSPPKGARIVDQQTLRGTE